jgi:hypothetical protein
MRAAPPQFTGKGLEMAALPPNSTDRYFFHYANAVNPHTFVIRTGAGIGLSALITAVEAVLAALSPGFAASAGVGIDFQASGTNFSVPQSPGTWNSFTWGSGAADPEVDSVAANFQGRSLGGHKCRWGVFGWSAQKSNYRLTSLEDANVAAAVTVVNNTTGAFVAIDGLAPTWYEYVNIKANDYWVRQAR